MSIIKKVQDYYEQMYAKYPNVKKSDILRILQYGWKSFYLHNSCGGDVLINRRDFWMYCGKLTTDSVKFFNYYKEKISVKLRVMYKRLQIPWDGYYYFGLSAKLYDDYLKLKNKKGRPRKFFTFNKIVLYKIYDDCCIKESAKIAIFRIPMLLNGNFTIFKEELKTDKAELILTRDPLKFDDILLSKYNYQFISDNLRKYKHKKLNENS